MRLQTIVDFVKKHTGLPLPRTVKFNATPGLGISASIQALSESEKAQAAEVR